MKKIALLLVLATISYTMVAQQDSPTAKGNKLINIGTGIFGGSGGLNFTPIHFGMDFLVVNNLSVGGDLNWRYYNTQSNVGKPSLISFQVVVDYHLNEVMHLSPQWDFYGGVKLGPGYMMTDEDLEAENIPFARGVKFVADFRVGARYYFNDNLGINSEIGVLTVSGTKTTGATFLIGITIKK